MTKIAGMPDRDQAKPGMAHFAGMGPAGKTCGDCKHRGYRRPTELGKSRYVGKCAMYRTLTARHGADVRRTYPACKYYEGK